MTPKKSVVKKVKAWAVVMFDGFIPDFNVEGKMENVMQIHSTKKAAVKFAEEINKNTVGPQETLWAALPCTITYSLSPKNKK